LSFIQGNGNNRFAGNISIMKIRRVDVLREYDIKETPQGKQVVFSIKFVIKSGELVFLPRAVASGLPWNMSNNRQRGVLPVDNKGEKAGHVYPVGIDNFIEWNGKRVIL
jgi:hypothetical protein